MAIVLGANLRVAVYPGATPMLHDAASARIIDRLLRSRHSRWRAEVEARVPGPGRSSTDVRLSDPRTVVLIEIETRLRRWEATARRCFEKRERVRNAAPIGTNVFAVLCLPPTRHHRQVVADLGEYVRVAFPTPADEIRRALEDGTDWPGDGILWIAGGPMRHEGNREPKSGP